MANNFFWAKGLLVRFEEKEVSGGRRVASFNVLLSEPRKQDEEQKDDGTFINVEAWNLPENVSSYMNDNVKQVQVAFQGRLKQDRWEKDGAKRSAYKIIADVDSVRVTQKRKAAAPVKKEKVAASSGNDIPF